MKSIYFTMAWVALGVGGVLTLIAAGRWWIHRQEQLQEQTVVEQETKPEDFAPIRNGRVKGIQTVVESEDARALIVAQFLERYNSPLQPYDHFGEVFVELADQHEFDFRLLPAIAMQESNLCKRIPPGSYNCLGFGIHERGTLTFESFEANFSRAARELKQNYIDIGLTTPEEIMTKYTPGSNGSWADSVNQWMAEMRYNDRTKGIESEDDASVLEFVEP